MISNQVLQNTIDGLKSIARVELCVMDVEGKEVASTMDMSHCSPGSCGVCSFSRRFPGNSGVSVF